MKTFYNAILMLQWILFAGGILASPFLFWLSSVNDGLTSLALAMMSLVAMKLDVLSFGDFRR